MASLTGTTLGKYQITERLGRGGMAEVYKAFHPQLERYAAVKILHGFLADGQDFLARFQREAKAVAALQHPNIVQIYDIDINDDYYYMVMEFIDSGTLKDRLVQSGGKLSIAEMAHIFRGIAAALEYAHTQGVLHRDIKPANVLLGKGGRVVLTDFGIARIVSDTQFTATGTLIGTPAYMSPEQGMGMTVSAASDIYSLGVILYEMVTGKVPFDSETPLAVIHKHINEPLPSPREFRDDIPKTLEQVITKALAKEPNDRYQTASEMILAVDAAFDEFQQITQSETIVEPPSDEILPDLKVDPYPKPTIASKATVAMQPDEIPAPQETITSKTTIAMAPDDEDIAAKATIAMQPVDDIASKATIVMESEETHPPKPAILKPAQKPIAKEAPKAKPTNKPPIKGQSIILGVIGAVIIIALLAWGIPKLSGGGADCDSPESCQGLADELWMNGDANGAVEAVDTALNYVPSNEHPPYAQLWCLRGDILGSLDQINEAIGSFEDCINWTEGDPDPGMEELRNFAQEQIDMLNQR